MKTLFLLTIFLLFVAATIAATCEETAPGFQFSDPDDCRAYFLCVDEYSPPVRQVCPPGTHFYVGRQMCVQPEECDL
ncbi:hypothetical protein Bhyg_09508 [Pseudolycoriella hygida]|uniref:Chitin-binding type-2 domain-containing protein n=1 Tax=Pseudolycoriella hygida TaxID=35572 RepID=A0A9Q0N6T6_9DIPT|nr:hypothetical protein Bhyg_09508 [Pseudolycoriella hygida]